MKTFFRIAVCFALTLPAALPAQWALYFNSERGGVHTVLEAPDGNLLISGSGYIFKLSPAGQPVWGRSFNPLSSCWGGDRVWLTPDGGCVAAIDECWEAATMFKLSPSGNVEWRKTYTLANSHLEVFSPTPDGGAILAGSLGAYLLLCKCSADGEIEWQKSYGTDRADKASGVAVTSDGGVLVLGSSRLPENPDGSPGEADLWVLKLSSTGAIEWQKLIGGAADDEGEWVRQTADGGYLLAGHSASFDPDRRSHLWLMKLSGSGVIERQLQFPYLHGGYNWLSIHPVSSGGFIAAVRPGGTEVNPELANRAVIMRISDGGVVSGTRIYPTDCGVMAMWPTADGGCLLSMAGGEGNMDTNTDTHVMKLAPSGGIEWQKLYGSQYSQDELACVREISDGGYVLAGVTSSWGGAGWEDASWVMKTAPDGTINPYCYFIKSAFSEPMDEPDLWTEIEAAVKDTVAVPQSTGLVAETADISINVRDTNALQALGRPTSTLTMRAETQGGTTTPAPGSYVYDTGTRVQISAIPNHNYRFLYWYDNISLNGQSSVAIVMDGDKQITAGFHLYSDGDGGTTNNFCFIATAAYGTPSHPHVMLLRAFRDRYLAQSRLGRSLVDFYYKHSPPLARFIKKHEALRTASRIVLLPAVALSYVLVRLGPMPAVLFALSMLILLWHIVSRTRKRHRTEA